VLKSLRTLKLARLVRLNRIKERWLSRSAVDPSAMELIKFSFMTLILAHWLACIWGFEGNNYSDLQPIDLETW
jgi:hypothetical protein